MLSKINTKIKKREYPKDVFITPIPLAKICISKHNINKKDIWYDPFKNNGSFYNNFPNEIKNKKWSEILENKDFFKFNEKVDIISSNPPYSMLDKVFIKTLCMQHVVPPAAQYLLLQTLTLMLFMSLMHHHQSQYFFKFIF